MRCVHCRGFRSLICPHRLGVAARLAVLCRVLMMLCILLAAGQGNFVGNEFSGAGTYKFTDGATYEGAWKQNKCVAWLPAPPRYWPLTRQPSTCVCSPLVLQDAWQGRVRGCGGSAVGGQIPQRQVLQRPGVHLTTVVVLWCWPTNTATSLCWTHAVLSPGFQVLALQAHPLLLRLGSWSTLRTAHLAAASADNRHPSRSMGERRCLPSTAQHYTDTYQWWRLRKVVNSTAPHHAPHTQ